MTAGRIRRDLRALDERIWEAAIIMQRHGDEIAEAYSVQDIQALFKAYGRLNGVASSGDRPADEDEVAHMRTLKESWEAART